MSKYDGPWSVRKTRQKGLHKQLLSDCYHCTACFFLLFPAFTACIPNGLEKKNKLLQLSLVNCFSLRKAVKITNPIPQHKLCL